MIISVAARRSRRGGRGRRAQRRAEHLVGTTKHWARFLTFYTSVLLATQLIKKAVRPFAFFSRTQLSNSSISLLLPNLKSKPSLATVLYGKTNPEHSKKSGKSPKMGVPRALRARRTPIFRIFLEFSGWIYFSIQYCFCFLCCVFSKIGQDGRPGRRESPGTLYWLKLVE